MIHKNVKPTFISLLIAAIISIGIGTVFMFIGTKGHKIEFSQFLWNCGYSVSLGLGLFANGVLFQRIEIKYISWIKAPIRSLLIAILVHLTYSSFIIFFVNWIWFIVIIKDTLTHFFTYGWSIIFGEYIVLIIITSIIYAKSFFKEYRDEAIQGERLKQEAIALQYQVMQNQVNPHFLFNTLNILGSLIDVDKEKAKQFTRELSMFYRELLSFKNKELVSLKDEIEFVKKYIYLQKIRFGENFDVDIQINDDENDEIIPMSIQMMIENAVKHNIISKEKPLKVLVKKTTENNIIVENNRQAKESIVGSNKIGLENLTHRYKFLTNKELKVESDIDIFRVTFPIVRIEN